MRGEFSGTEAPQSTNKTRARTRGSSEADAWRLEPHVCRACFARVVSKDAGDGYRTYQCTNCGLEAVGSKVSVVCACGMTMRKGGKSGTTGVLQDMGVRCHRNQAVSPELPAQYVASYGGIQVEEA